MFASSIIRQRLPRLNFLSPVLLDIRVRSCFKLRIDQRLVAAFPAADSNLVLGELQLERFAAFWTCRM